MEITLIDYVEPIFANAELKNFHKSWTLKQKLMLIITELSESVEADRKNNICGDAKREYFEERIKLLPSFPVNSFKNNIKDTLEDELADVFIRICDLLGLLYRDHASYNEIMDRIEKMSKTSTQLVFAVDNYIDIIFNITDTIRNIYHTDYTTKEIFFGSALAQIFQLAERMQIPLKKHVDWKMQYNASRPTMHGGKY